MSTARGIGVATASVLLASGAQLGMRWSMSRLPTPTQWPAALEAGELAGGALTVVALAIIAYGLSMLCWLAALRDLPLGRAYSLLSISYVLVYVLAASLPLFDEGFTSTRTLGVALVTLGVLTINFRSTTGPRDLL
jgi:undecaprenyl phosphate-alpha-L-ara4N flippase subunit ArnF